jgi:hypothetical protein
MYDGDTLVLLRPLRHCEELSDEAIHICVAVKLWIASLRSQ